jgi:hypothetical protein
MSSPFFLCPCHQQTRPAHSRPHGKGWGPPKANAVAQSRGRDEEPPVGSAQCSRASRGRDGAPPVGAGAAPFATGPVWSCADVGDGRRRSRCACRGDEGSSRQRWLAAGRGEGSSLCRGRLGLRQVAAPGARLAGEDRGSWSLCLMKGRDGGLEGR